MRSAREQAFTLFALVEARMARGQAESCMGASAAEYNEVVSAFSQLYPGEFERVTLSTEQMKCREAYVHLKRMIDRADRLQHPAARLMIQNAFPEKVNE